MSPFCVNAEHLNELCLQPCPYDMTLEAIREQQNNKSAPVGRYVLIIDTIKDDYILRALQSELSSHNASCKVLKLSQFSEGDAAHQVNIIYQVKWAAEKE